MTDFQIIDKYESDRVLTSLPGALRPLPGPGVEFDLRPGTVDDVPWIDALQKEHKRGLGFMRFGELEGHLRKGNVYVAVAAGAAAESGGGGGGTSGDGGTSGGTSGGGRRMAYCIAADRYYQRDEVGQIYQMCVDAAYRRMRVGANLLRRVWETWPRGVKLCGCWCAQDLEANRYWEGCGFTAVGFRAGSRTAGGKTRKEPRVHIYWQKRINAGDGDAACSSGGGGNSGGSSGGGGTPFWYPKQTQGGAMNEARIVFPIPPGSSWEDAKPAVYPGVEELFETIAAERAAAERQALLRLAPPPGSGAKQTKAEREAARAERAAKRAEAAARTETAAGHGGLRIGWNAAPIEAVPSEAEVKAEAAASKQKLRDAKRAAKAAAKKAARAMRSRNDPVLVAAARDLRDRWMQAVQADPGLLSLPGGSASGEAPYDVGRQIGDPPAAGAAKRVDNTAGDAKRLAA